MLSGCDNQLHHMPDVYSVLVALLMVTDFFLPHNLCLPSFVTISDVNNYLQSRVRRRIRVVVR